MTINETVEECTAILDSILDDTSVPRNIRRAADEIKNILSDQNESIPFRAASSLNILNKITNDPNMPQHTRTLIWNLASQFEMISVGD
ncbi:MAG: UPF0147 family protein [Methanosarcinales archaeon]|nr:UPF0147 family protein [Methanosarcinales archaeon]HDJ37880.1 UPF0147 family protein [Methanosarcinales archaeon]